MQRFFQLFGKNVGFMFREVLLPLGAILLYLAVLLGASAMAMFAASQLIEGLGQPWEALISGSAGLVAGLGVLVVSMTFMDMRRK